MNKKNLKSRFLKNELKVTTNRDGLKMILNGFLKFQMDAAKDKIRFECLTDSVDIYLNDFFNRHADLSVEDIE